MAGKMPIALVRRDCVKAAPTRIDTRAAESLVASGNDRPE